MAFGDGFKNLRDKILAAAENGGRFLAEGPEGKVADVGQGMLKAGEVIGKEGIKELINQAAMAPFGGGPSGVVSGLDTLSQLTGGGGAAKDAQAIVGLPGTNPFTYLLRGGQVSSIQNRLGHSRINPYLNTETRLWDLFDLANIKNLPQLRHPSFGLVDSRFTPAEAVPFLEDLAIIPNPEFINRAAKTGRADIANRDTFTPRSRYDPLAKHPDTGKSFLASPRGTESGSYSPGHLLQMLASPRFKSLQEWENSPAGHKTLETYKRSSGIQIEGARRMLENILKQHYGLSTGNTRMDRDIIEAITEYDPKVKYAKTERERAFDKQITKFASKVPSDYGEVKYLGNMPITGETTSGILTKVGAMSDYQFKELSDYFEGLGVPVRQFDEFNSGHDIYQAIDALFELPKIKVRPDTYPGFQYPGPKDLARKNK